MAGSGVGGIKDSQGNYEIIGKGDSVIGTRSGTLRTTVGDVPSQATGRMYTKLLFEDSSLPTDIWTVSMQGFTGGNPPTAPLEYVSLQGGANSLRLEVFPDGDSSAEGAGLLVQNQVVSGSGRISSRLFGKAVILGSLAGSDTQFVPNRVTSSSNISTSTASTLLTLSFNVSNGDDVDVTMPFTCKIVDAWVIGLAATDTVTLRRLPPVGPPDAVTTTLNGAGATSIVRATTVTTDTFTSSSALPLFQTKLRVHFTGVNPISCRLCVSIIRVGEVV